MRIHEIIFKSRIWGKEIETMDRKIKITSLAFIFITFTTAAVYSKTDSDIFFSAAVTFGTISYHFVMRLAAGAAVNCIMHNRADYKKGWFRTYPFEKKVYEKLRVKSWKDKLPSYDRDIFSLKKHSFDELAQASCQAELVHEIIAVLSFLPLSAVPKFGAFPVFFITSLLAACFDMLFVIIQRYNRPRFAKLAAGESKTAH